VHRPMAEWHVLIKDHHEAYITWDEFERNQRAIANNAAGKGSVGRQSPDDAARLCDATTFKRAAVRVHQSVSARGERGLVPDRQRPFGRRRS
jgi:hypothetical protein